MSINQDMPRALDGDYQGPRSPFYSPAYYGTDSDERLKPHGAPSRDIGRNPQFNGSKPKTRADDHNAAMSTVGGYGNRDETVTTFAATAIGFYGQSSQTVATGSGSIKAITIEAISTFRGRLRVNGPTGPVLAYFNLSAQSAQTIWFGDHGVNYNSLYIEQDLGGGEYRGSVMIASTE